MRITSLMVGVGLLSACAQAGGSAGDDEGSGGAVDASNQRMVRVTMPGTGAGTVTSLPTGIDCPGDCEELYANDQSVSLTAVAGAGSMFAGWGGACSGTGTCAITTGGTAEVFAMFTPVQYGLTVTKSGNGTGTVTSSPGGIACGATCAALFDEGTVVTLMATPGTATSFTGWSGGGCTGTGTCTVTLAAAASVTASFQLATYTLTVTKTGPGTVTSTPSGISCGADCTEVFTHGTNVLLTAAPSASGTFTGWSGACSGTGTCSVPMTQVQSVGATFTGPLTCSTLSTANACTNGPQPEINLGQISSSSCRTQCQTQMGNAGMSSGCWLVALNNNCYCRSGALSTGGNRPGGSCN